LASGPTTTCSTTRIQVGKDGPRVIADAATDDIRNNRFVHTIRWRQLERQQQQQQQQQQQPCMTDAPTNSNQTRRSDESGGTNHNYDTGTATTTAHTAPAASTAAAIASCYTIQAVTAQYQKASTATAAFCPLPLALLASSFWLIDALTPYIARWFLWVIADGRLWKRQNGTLPPCSLSTWRQWPSWFLAEPISANHSIRDHTLAIRVGPVRQIEKKYADYLRWQLIYLFISKRIYLLSFSGNFSRVGKFVE
jgi:hypothetical protein